MEEARPCKPCVLARSFAGCPTSFPQPQQAARLVLTTAVIDEKTHEIAVVDSGPELAKAVADQVFGPFVSTKRHGTIVRSTVPFILRYGGVSAC
jgi:hypothetical protein